MVMHEYTSAKAYKWVATYLLHFKKGDNRQRERRGGYHSLLHLLEVLGLSEVEQINGPDPMVHICIM